MKDFLKGTFLASGATIGMAIAIIIILLGLCFLCLTCSIIGDPEFQNIMEDINR